MDKDNVHCKKEKCSLAGSQVVVKRLLLFPDLKWKLKYGHHFVQAPSHEQVRKQLVFENYPLRDIGSYDALEHQTGWCKHSCKPW